MEIVVSHLLILDGNIVAMANGQVARHAAGKVLNPVLPPIEGRLLLGVNRLVGCKQAFGRVNLELALPQRRRPHLELAALLCDKGIMRGTFLGQLALGRMGSLFRRSQVPQPAAAIARAGN